MTFRILPYFIFLVRKDMFIFADILTRKDLTDCTPLKKNAKTELLSQREVILKSFQKANLNGLFFYLRICK